jgi:DNA-binding MarR family transcriptional regulator
MAQLTRRDARKSAGNGAGIGKGTGKGTSARAKGQGKSRVALTQSDYERLAAFRHALRCFMEFSQTAARAAGLTPQQHQALLAIKGMPDNAGVTIGDLAGRLLVRHHSAVELVDRLAQNGLLRRDSDGQDGRRALLVLTAKGESALLELSAAHLEELSRVGPELSKMLSAFVPTASSLADE